METFITAMLVLGLNVIAWIAGYFKGMSSGHYSAISQIGDAMLEMGVSKADVSRVIDKAIERLHIPADEQKTPTDEQ